MVALAAEGTEESPYQLLLVHIEAILCYGPSESQGWVWREASARPAS